MATRHALTPTELGPRSSLLVHKHAEYIASFSNIWEVRHCTSLLQCHTKQQQLPTSCLPLSPHTQQGAEKLEHVATEHFWMNGMYWGLTAMALLGRLDDMDTAKILDWVSVEGCVVPQAWPQWSPLLASSGIATQPLGLGHTQISSSRCAAQCQQKHRALVHTSMPSGRVLCDSHHAGAVGLELLSPRRRRLWCQPTQ